MIMKQNGFNIDDNYFNELEEKILSRVNQFEKKRKQRRDLLTKVVLPSALLIIFLTAGFSFFGNRQNPDDTIQHYLAYTEALEYLDISDYEVNTLMDEYYSGETTTDDNTDAIVDYLSEDNSIDYDLIYENQ